MSKRTEAFDELERRAVESRVTIAELVEMAGVSRVTYWRARTGNQARSDSFIPTLRKLEGVLTTIEAKRMEQ